jgi:hypothetical protein
MASTKTKRHTALTAVGILVAPSMGFDRLHGGVKG